MEESIQIDSNSQYREVIYGKAFPVNDRYSYTITAMVKIDNSAELLDNFTTFITELNGEIDTVNSIGIGVRMKFFDKDYSELIPPDRRQAARIITLSELSTTEYYKLQADIENKDVPDGAFSAQLIVFAYGLKAGGVIFKRIEAFNLGQFFYCTKEHESSDLIIPNLIDSDDGEIWTQDFLWRPSYGSRSRVVAHNEAIELGEGNDYVNSLAINSLPLEIDVTFANRTDQEAKAIIHFLQEKTFSYESIFAINYKGERLLSTDVASFKFPYTLPYRKDLMFTCIDFSHSFEYRNNHSISAKFICNTESTLRSVESHSGFNKRLDAIVPIFIDQKTEFKKGETVKLNTFSLEESDGTTILTDNVDKIKIGNFDGPEQITFYLSTFTTIDGLSTQRHAIDVNDNTPAIKLFSNTGLNKFCRNQYVAFFELGSQVKWLNSLVRQAFKVPDLWDQLKIEYINPENQEVIREYTGEDQLREQILHPDNPGDEHGFRIGFSSERTTPNTDNNDLVIADFIDIPEDYFYIKITNLNTYEYIESPPYYVGPDEGIGKCENEYLPIEEAKKEEEEESELVEIYGELFFKQAPGLAAGDCIFIDVNDELDSAFDIGKTKIISANTGLNFTFGPIVTNKSIADVFPENIIKVIKLERCPEDCLNNRALLPDGIENIPPTLIDPETGKEQKRVVVLKNYRKFQIESNITVDTSTVELTPMADFTLEADEDFQILIPAIRGRSSIYIENPNEIEKFPWLQVRSFEHSPSLAFSIGSSPDHQNSGFIKFYQKKYKKQINHNLSTFSIVFDQRSDKEAKEILQFFESHLGYKKFRFAMPRPYSKDFDHLTTPARSNISTFYCPNWEHQVVYKNNHKITATFIGSNTSIEEDLFKVFGIGQEEERPCYAAYIEDPITKHSLCTFSSTLQANICGGLELSGLTVKQKAVDLIFIVDGSGSMRAEVSAPGVKTTKFDAAIDLIKKIVSAHDEYIVPETFSYGVFDAPQISFGDISGDTSVPPWPVDSSLNSIMSESAEDMYIDLKDQGYNIENLKRFKVPIEQKLVHTGLVIMTNPGTYSVYDLSNKPNGYDKKYIYNKLQGSFNRQVGENFPDALSTALAQMYNSPRAQYVTDRLIVAIGDGQFTNDGGDNGSQLTGYHFWNQPAVEISKAIKPGGELAKRRPKDSILSKYGYGSYNPKYHIQKYGQQSKDGKSLLVNPDLGADNPDWYEESLPTVLMMATVGVFGRISKFSRVYAFDYDGPYPPNEPDTSDLKFLFKVTDGGSRNQEIKRLLDLIRTIEILTTDSGYENIFQVTVHNCGPNDVKIKNTLININSQSTPMKFTTERLKSGMVKGGDIKNVKTLSSSEGIGSINNGYGGQFYGDSNNQGVLVQGAQSSNVLWESFNTEYEVYRDCKLHLIDKGWEKKSSNGVLNTGVAFKGMPVRVFKADTGVEVIDYNIGNVNEGNSYMGDYSHLPKIKAGESLDFFFGVRANNVANLNDVIQFVFNSDDETPKKTDCYATVELPINIGEQDFIKDTAEIDTSASSRRRSRSSVDITTGTPHFEPGLPNLNWNVCDACHTSDGKGQYLSRNAYVLNNQNEGGEAILYWRPYTWYFAGEVDMPGYTSVEVHVDWDFSLSPDVVSTSRYYAQRTNDIQSGGFYTMNHILPDQSATACLQAWKDSIVDPSTCGGNKYYDWKLTWNMPGGGVVMTWQDFTNSNIINWYVVSSHYDLLSKRPYIRADWFYITDRSGDRPDRFFEGNGPYPGTVGLINTIKDRSVSLIGKNSSDYQIITSTT